jgi:hypothetical protein
VRQNIDNTAIPVLQWRLEHTSTILNSGSLIFYPDDLSLDGISLLIPYHKDNMISVANLMPYFIAIVAPVLGANLRHGGSPSSSRNLSNRVPTRAPLSSGQYFFSPTKQLITGIDVCALKVR